MSDALRLAGQLAADYAVSLWELDIYDASIRDKTAKGVRSKDVISQITEACNWGHYKGNGSGVQWCTMFWFYCWAKAANLDPQWLKHHSQSTLRAEAWATYKPFSGHPNPKPTRPEFPTTAEYVRYMYSDAERVYQKFGPGLPVPGFVPQAGDMVIVGDGTPAAGDHATMCIGYDHHTGDIDTIAGNGGGVGPMGNSREGISRKTFTVGQPRGYRPMWLSRPGYADLILEKP